MPLSTGEVLYERYRIVRLLGQGGFGAVYRAWDLHLSRPLALKENLDTSPEAQRQFKREAQLLFDLSHPHLPKLFDCFSVPGQGQYLVMEYVDGEDLLQLQRRAGGPLPEAQVLAWAGQVCAALVYLHSHQPPVIHRDVKPANIKLTPDGLVKLVDFGIAKLYDPHSSTTAGARAVTLGYSPPEQYGHGATDARSDVYALGATLYRLLTGVDPLESIERSLGKALPLPRALTPSLSLQTELAILMAMELRPQNRFASAQEFREALLGGAPPILAQPVAGGQVVAAPVTAAQVVEPPAIPAGGSGFPAGKPSSARTPAGASRLPAPRSGPLWPALLGALVVFALLAAAGLAFWFGSRLGSPPAAPAAAASSAAPASSPQPAASPHIADTLPPVTQPQGAGPQLLRPTPTPLPPTPVPPTPVPPTPAPPTRRPPTRLPPSAPAPRALPQLRLDKNFFCRGGPGATYDQIWSFAAGSTLEIIGRSSAGWWLVQFQDSRTSHDKCWISGGVVQGDASQVPYSNYVTVK